MQIDPQIQKVMQDDAASIDEMMVVINAGHALFDYVSLLLNPPPNGSPDLSLETAQAAVDGWHKAVDAMIAGTKARAEAAQAAAGE